MYCICCIFLMNNLERLKKKKEKKRTRDLAKTFIVNERETFDTFFRYTSAQFMCNTYIHITCSYFKLYRRMIQFASARFVQYLVKRSVTDKRRDVDCSAAISADNSSLLRRRKAKFKPKKQLQDNESRESIDVHT